MRVLICCRSIEEIYDIYLAMYDRETCAMVYIVDPDGEDDRLMPGDWEGPQADSYENFKEYIFEKYRNFPEGEVETYIHPAYETDELKGTSGAWQRRVWEYKLFSDPKTQQFIKDIGIKLINYRDLAAMRSTK